ncbi:MAG: hypothetical protein WCR74_21810 [Betaproteobacteria bacterium]
MGAVQENRPQLQLRRPAGRELLHNTPAAGALVVRDTPGFPGVPGVSAPAVTRVAQLPSVPRFVSVPLVPPELPDAAGALLRYGALMRRLDRWLDAPLVVKRDTKGHLNSHTVWLLDAVGYRVNRRTRTVYAVYHQGGYVRRGSFNVDLMAFLRRPYWLEFVVRRLGLSDCGAQGQLFGDDAQVEAEEQWLCRAAYRALRRDPRFTLLQRERLPRALGLDPVLLAIALAARELPECGWLDSTDFNLVWRHEALFRALAREAPQLLPLAAVALREDKLPAGEDPLAALHALCAAHGLRPATWRYLLRHGVRWLQPVWRATGHGRRITVTLEVLRAFERAGHPPPPPAREMRDWFEYAHEPELGDDCDGLPPEITAACCAAARSQAARHDVIARAEILLALRWGHAERPQLDKPQRRAGWPWVRRQALAWARRDRLASAGRYTEGEARWPAPLPGYEAAGFRARAIASAEELVDAALAFHNCLADFANACRAGGTHVFVIRNLALRQDVAVAAFSCAGGAAHWRLQDIKGPCNLPVSGALAVFACRLLQAFADACPLPAPAGLVYGPPLDIACLRLDGDGRPDYVCEMLRAIEG